MFSFIKKAGTTVVADKDDKERRKRDKKDRKDKQKRDRPNLSAEELLRLDEVRRSLKIRGRRRDKEKLPSGITADYTAAFLANLEPPRQDARSDSSEASLENRPSLPPRPPKRGILKTSRSGAVNGTVSTSPSADSLTDATGSPPFATPPFSLSPVGESHGLYRWSRPSSYDTPPAPPVLPPALPAPRTLRVVRQPSGEFGFALRRAMLVDRVGGESRVKAAMFAEPGGGADGGLLPGDRLLAVNGALVEGRSGEEVIEMVRRSGDAVELKVQPIAELSELSRRLAYDGREIHLDENNIKGATLKRSGSRRFDKSTAAKSEEHLEREKQWLGVEKVWLSHRAGFSSALKEKSTESEPGKIKIKLEHSGEVIIVDEDDIERQNPPQYDRAEDLATLRHLNESSVLHTLRQRYGSNLIHTYCGGGGVILVLNPMAPLAIYSEKVAAMFKGCKSEDMPPHIYAMAQSCYQTMSTTRRDQGLVFMGRSGSGKTTNFRHCIHYLTTTAGSTNKIITPEKLNAVWTLLEAFGNCRSVLNANATKFSQIFALDFDQMGALVGGHLQVLLLEKTRAVKRVDSESTFHVMGYLICGAEGLLRKELGLDVICEQNSFFGLPQRSDDRARAQQEFIRVCHGMESLGITGVERKCIFSVLGAIYNIACAGAVKASTGRYQFGSPQHAQRAANLLGTTSEELSRLLFGPPSAGGSVPQNKNLRSPSPTDKNVQDKEVVVPEAVEGLIIGLYAEVFACVIGLINRSISSPSHAVSSILLVDTPGFQNPATCGRQVGASFDDLCQNYVQERLQLLFHNANIVAPKDRYVQENIDIHLEENENENSINPLPMVNLLDKTAQNSVIRTSQNDLHESDRRGLLWLLDEEAVYPGASDESFLERLFAHYGDRSHQILLRKAEGNHDFVLQHLQGTNPVLYNAKGWLKASRENPYSRSAVVLLQESCREELSKMFVGARGLSCSIFGGSVVSLEGSQSLRRASSVRRTFTSSAAAMKRKSVCLQVKFAVDGLVETLRRTKLHFVQCLLPQHNAAVAESSANFFLNGTSSNGVEDHLVNVPLLRSQVRGFQALDALRLFKSGFPRALNLGEFRRRFALLAGEEANGRVALEHLDERLAAERMLKMLDLEPASYRVGLSQIFFRNGVVQQLETQRDERLASTVTALQARCRGHLARKKLRQRRLQDTAARCIQRNVRKFMLVRDWPWWRLLVRVTPLLNVHRTEEELRAKTEELEAVKLKLEKSEAERSTLKYENDKLESKMPLIPSLYSPVSSPSMKSSSFLETYPSSTSLGYPLSTFSSNSSITSSLPPPIPSSSRRPIRRSYTAGLDVPSERKPVGFQTRPLKCLTVLSDGPRSVRSPSPASSAVSNYSLRSNTCPPPRRIYPQNSYSSDLECLEGKDDSPVVFDANLTFVLGCKSKLKQRVKPVPAHLERETQSNALSNKINDFLNRTDHVMDEWRHMGHKDDDCNSARLRRARSSCGRSKSATNIMIKGFQYFSRASSVSRSSVARDLGDEDNDNTLDCDELSEMTADLAEEHSTATLAGERLEAETSERLRLEKELSDAQHKNKDLQQASERLEMELIYARSDLNGIAEEDEDAEGDGVYKQRYERALRELEFTKRRLQQQHEDDLEQLVGLKKQLEKKLADAYEEVEEQRQVVGTWKRKVQKLNGEMNDLKLLLEEQSSRNNLLEKKQRKFDSETQLLQDELKKEKQTRDRLSREKEVLIAEKYGVESSLADTRLELDLKEEKLSSLQREFDEVTCGGKTEEEVTVLRKQKIDCERRLQDQEEELDELAGQVQLLEQAKLRLEMTLESMRKDAKKEAQMRDEEMEEVRGNAQKKVKALEQQLENEHEERTSLLRERHELERRLQHVLEDDRRDRAGDEALLHRLKRDLKRTKVLLRDTQAQLERQKAEAPGKNVIRQLRNQLEDVECSRAAAVKAKQGVEGELVETQALLDEAHKQKQEAEDRANLLLREKSDLQSQLEENEEEMCEVMKKYKTAVQQMSLDQAALQEQVSLVSELELERNKLKEQLAELSSKLENVENMGDVSSNLLLKRSELKVKELESKLDLEQTTRSRLEVQIARLKESVDKLQTELASTKVKEQQAQDQIRKLQRNLREVKEELNKSLAKESEVIIKKKELEKRCEHLEAESSSTRTDLRLALKRIEDLQSAIQGEMEDSISDNSESEQDSYSSDDSVNTFLSNHKSDFGKSEKNDTRRLSNTSRSSTSSNLGKDSSYA